MAATHDWIVYEAAGLVPPDEPARQVRLELLEYLLGEGCTLDEMVAAEARGRLFALAGDRVLRPGARTITLAEAAADIGIDEDLVRRLWRALGLEGWDSADGVASPDDVGALQYMAGAVALTGEDRALELARSVGAGLSRIGEATNTVGRSLSPDGSLATSGSEVDTARYWGAVAPMVTSMGRLLDVLSRHHFELAREHFERSGSFDLMHRRRARVAVGFVDMSGFTNATERLGDDAFERLLASFATRVSETVRDLGGRVVKLVGDAAMVVAPNPLVMATIAHELVDGWAEPGETLTLHAGLAHGEVLSQDGDYYGSAVNLAARLSALADPGTILASASLGEALPEADWIVEWLDPQPVRGIGEPVTACAVRRRG